MPDRGPGLQAPDDVGQARRWTSSVFRVANSDSASALSKVEPTRPFGAGRPEARSALPTRRRCAGLPRSVRCTVPAAGWRVVMGMPTAPRKRSVRRWSAIAQPITLRLKASTTIAR
jgi:hypothetical protein